jgi:hypothetical protein
MKNVLIGAMLFALISSANAGAVAGRSGTSGGQQTGSYGGHSGASAGVGAGASGQGQSGNATGRAYFAPSLNGSAVDQYQPWPQSEMKQFQKP